MKGFHILLLAFYSLSPVAAEYLREGGGTWEVRRLQNATNPPGTNPPGTIPPNGDTTGTGNTTDAARVQDAINETLPEINYKLRGALHDPYDLSLVATVPIDCGTLTLNMAFDELQGLSTVNVDQLTIHPDSFVLVEDECDTKKYAAKGDILVSFGSSLVATRTRARLEGRCKGRVWSTGVSNSLAFSGVSFTGSYNLIIEGKESESNSTSNVTMEEIEGIKKAETLGLLDLNIASVTATVGGLPPALEEFNVTISNQLAAAFRKQIVDEIEPELRYLLETYIPDNCGAALGLGLRSVSNFFSGFFSGLVEAATDALGDGLSDIFG